MKETPAAFTARTGARYQPALPDARPLGDDEPCPTLFRYPGPGALHETLARALPSLAPPGAAIIWLHADPLAAAPIPVARWGALVVLEPLHLSPSVIDDAYAAVARRVPDDAVVWLPPSRVSAGGVAWDGVATLAEARALLGPTWDDERGRVLDELGTYLEELAELARAGAPPPAAAWCAVAPEERARILAAHGLTGRWTLL